jgi:hypothetical protein
MLLAGAVAPDLPVMLLFAGTVAIERLNGTPFRECVEHFSASYFQDPLWVSAHSLLHSPVCLFAGFALVSALASNRTRLPLFSFLCGCTLHSLADFATHYDDGPLLLWPFDWETRLHSPVSHWDPAHFGIPFLCAEAVMNFAGGYWLLRVRAHADGERLAAILIPGRAAAPMTFP